MDKLQGLPDFQSPLSNADLLMYAPFGTGSYGLLPSQIGIARDASGKPKFELALVNVTGDLSAAGQYAVLDVRLGGNFQLDEALGAVRATASDATVQPVSINLGFARLYSTTASVMLPAEMTQPISLGNSPPDFARWTMRLSADAGELIKGALSSGALLFGARIEFEILGVAPRIGVGVEFNPAQLLGGLLAGTTARQIADSDILKFFTGSAGALPLKFIGTLRDQDADLFPQTMADRITSAYSTLIPAPALSDPAFRAFVDPGMIPSSTIQWDLSQPAVAPRQWVFMLDSLKSLQSTDTATGLNTLVKDITVPPANLGCRQINLSANLPANRIGIPAIGVNIEVAANPPLRPSPINPPPVLFAPPDNQADVQFCLSPAETLQYTVSGFAVLAAGASVQEYDMPLRAGTATWVQLQSTDFPIVFSHVTTASRLVELAQINGTLTYSNGGKTVQQSFTLNAQAPDVAVAAPRSVTDAVIHLIAMPSDGSAAISLPPMAPGRVDLDLTLFREYGPHLVPLTCRFDAAGAAVFVELLADSQVDNPTATPDKRALTPSQPSDTWSYFAASPFRPGYRYRIAASAGAAIAAWSAVQSPFAALTINEDGTLTQ